MPLRPGRCDRRVKRPYTRKEYIKGPPDPKIRVFVGGSWDKDFEYALTIVADADIVVRSNALEALRVLTMKTFNKQIGSENYKYQVRAYPHHIIRKHALAGVHKAERLQKGMRLAFGRPEVAGAIVRRGRPILTVWVNKEHLELAKRLLQRVKVKVPPPTSVIVERAA
ncbi:MAG: 50S ribosomal protein L16 [Thermoproteota archaeon]|nr:MAG: 50S ribosomal protein L16 [Candidatus Korarchaeota archaeon]